MTITYSKFRHIAESAIKQTYLSIKDQVSDMLDKGMSTDDILKKLSTNQKFKNLVTTNLIDQMAKELGKHPVNESNLITGKQVTIEPTPTELQNLYPAANWLDSEMTVTLLQPAPNKGTIDVLSVRTPDGEEKEIYDFNICEDFAEDNLMDLLQDVAESGEPAEIRFRDNTQTVVDQEDAEAILDMYAMASEFNQYQLKQKLKQSKADFDNLLNFALQRMG